MKMQKIALAALLATALTGCSNKSVGWKNDSAKADVPIKIITEDGEEYASFDAMKAVFSPDFSYKYEEEKDGAEDADFGGAKSSAQKEKSESAIPGTRELSKYKTKYSEKRQKMAFPKTEESDEKIDARKAKSRPKTQSLLSLWSLASR